MKQFLRTYWYYLIAEAVFAFLAGWAIRSDVAVVAALCGALAGWFAAVIVVNCMVTEPAYDLIDRLIATCKQAQESQRTAIELCRKAQKIARDAMERA